MSRKFMWWSVSALTVVLLVVGAVITTIAVVDSRDARQTEDARRAALDAGAEAAMTMFGYNPDNVVQQVESARTYLSGKALQDYDETVAEADLALQVKQQGITSSVSVQQAGVITNTSDSALVLIFMNQSVTKGNSDRVGIEASRLELTMERSGDRWLVTNIDTITDDSVKAELADETNTQGASTVTVPPAVESAAEEPQPAPTP